MPIPNYPHPVPDPTAADYNKANPSGADVDQLPDLGTLSANLSTWLTEVDPTLKMKGLDLTVPGTVLILATGGAAPNISGFDTAKVLNGDVLNASYHGAHRTWKENNTKWINARPKFSKANADPGNYYVGDSFDLKGYSQSRNAGGTMAGYTDRENKKIFLNAHAERGDMLVHEYFHTADPGDPSDIGWGMDEGMVDFFARDCAVRWQYPYRGNGAYEGGYRAVKLIVDRIGLKVIAKLWFSRAPGITQKLGGITNRLAEFVKPGEEAKFDERLQAITPLIIEFCEEAKKMLPLDIVAPALAAAVKH